MVGTRGAISVGRIRQPQDPAKLYFGAKVAAGAGSLQFILERGRSERGVLPEREFIEEVPRTAQTAMSRSLGGFFPGLPTGVEARDGADYFREDLLLSRVRKVPVEFPRASRGTRIAEKLVQVCHRNGGNCGK